MHGVILPVKQFIAQRWFLTKLELVLQLEWSFSSVLQPLSDLECLRHAIVAGVIVADRVPSYLGCDTSPDCRFVGHSNQFCSFTIVGLW